ncbi:MAG: hypothetical protein IJQ26_07045, partial [Lachnospiraceae bacterium]|nr:hypothetical protein [Lachnospiraceae bacterium]
SSGGTQNAGAGQQGGGTTAPSGTSSVALDAEMDYSGKGVLFFGYPSADFTYSKGISDKITSNDGKIEMTFNAYGSGTASPEQRHQKLDGLASEAEYSSTETTIAGYDARVVKYIDSTMFNRPTMDVLIDITGSQDTYVLLHVSVYGKAMEDLDADEIFAILNSMHF